MTEIVRLLRVLNLCGPITILQISLLYFVKSVAKNTAEPYSWLKFICIKKVSLFKKLNILLSGILSSRLNWQLPVTAGKRYGNHHHSPESSGY